jgi:competence protein ComEC
MPKLNALIHKYGVFLYICLAISLFALCLSFFTRYYRFNPRLTVLNVGQGSSNLLELNERDVVIIDGGPDNTLIRKLGKMLPFWKRDILALVVTNGDKDHYFGFMDLCGSYRVGTLIVPPKTDNKEGFSELISCFRRQGTSIIQGYLGKNFKFGDFNLDILFPDRNMSGYKENDASLVLRLSGGHIRNSVMFMGDSPKKIERYLSKILEYINTDYIIVGHHGSKTSSDKKWISNFSGSTAVISAGKNNRYGHPNRETLGVLGDFRLKILNTMSDGDIEILL